jgi:hypothetical protein
MENEEAWTLIAIPLITSSDVVTQVSSIETISDVNPESPSIGTTPLSGNYEYP